MIFCDIDGTLIDSGHRISIDTRLKIQELYRAGVLFILVSARMPSGIVPLQRELGISAPIVCYNGALILNAQKEPIKTIGIEREKAMCIDAFIKTEWNHICSSTYSYDDWITDDIHNKWIKQEQNITGSVPLGNVISEFILPKRHIHKILCMGEVEAILELNAALKERFPEVSVYCSKGTYLEIMAGDVSKSKAVKFLCKNYEISIEATVSFGDNFNDVDMLLSTGTSYTMGNAPEEVKRLARNITLDNDHEGVLVGLNQLNFVANCNNVDKREKL